MSDRAYSSLYSTLGWCVSCWVFSPTFGTTRTRKHAGDSLSFFRDTAKRLSAAKLNKTWVLDYCRFVFRSDRSTTLQTRKM